MNDLQHYYQMKWISDRYYTLCDANWVTSRTDVSLAIYRQVNEATQLLYRLVNHLLIGQYGNCGCGFNLLILKVSHFHS